jgi:hypothetical protein
MPGGKESKGSPGRIMDSVEITRPSEGMKRLSTGDMKNGGVRIEIEPVAYRDGVLECRFYANTHVGNLGGHDLKMQARLYVEDAVYERVSVDKMRGHHASGVISFRVPIPPAKFSIKITGIPNVNEKAVHMVRSCNAETLRRSGEVLIVS